jgi:hypothetical protein
MRRSIGAGSRGNFVSGRIHGQISPGRFGAMRREGCSLVRWPPPRLRPAGAVLRAFPPYCRAGFAMMVTVLPATLPYRVLPPFDRIWARQPRFIAGGHRVLVQEFSPVLFGITGQLPDRPFACLACLAPCGLPCFQAGPVYFGPDFNYGAMRGIDTPVLLPV